MRARLTAIILCLYVLSINGYIYGFFYSSIDKFYLKLWLYWTLTIVISFLVLDELMGYQTNLHKHFNLIAKISVLINIILITFTYQIPIVNPRPDFLLFNGSIFVSTIMIVISGGRHGIFKD